MMGVDAEIESLRSTVSRHFPVTQIVVNPFAITFHVVVRVDALDANFDALRQELIPKNYVPTIVEEQGTTVIHIQRRPEPRFRGTYVNLLLLIVTIGTTWVAGAVNWQLYTNADLFTIDSFVFGFVSFTVPLLGILGAHEMAHYLTAKRHHVRASLPFFIPSVPILGTFGAFISMRDPIPDRKALLEIGVSGPLVGFLLALPITVVGLFLTGGNVGSPAVPTGGGEITMPSLLYGWIQSFFPASLVDPFRRHPTAFAGWVGLFVTAINLLPAGQLDGGHVARALLGDKQRYISWAAVVLLLVLGLGYPGWFLFALIILLLGVRHPPPLNDITKLKPTRQALGILAIVILILTFVPTPLIEVSGEPAFAFETATTPHVALTELPVRIMAGASRIVSLNLNNTGNVYERVEVWIDPQNLDSFGWTIRIENYTKYVDSVPLLTHVAGGLALIELNATEYATIQILVRVPAAASSQVYSWAVLGKIVEPATDAQALVVQLPVRITVP